MFTKHVAFYLMEQESISKLEEKLQCLDADKVHLEEEMQQLRQQMDAHTAQYNSALIARKAESIQLFQQLLSIDSPVKTNLIGTFYNNSVLYIFCDLSRHS